MRVGNLIAVATLFSAGAMVWTSQTSGLPAASSVVYAAEDRDRNKGDHEGNLDRDLAGVLSAAGFTGDIQTTFQRRIENNLRRPINPKLVELGRHPRPERSGLGDRSTSLQLFNSYIYQQPIQQRLAEVVKEALLTVQEPKPHDVPIEE